MSIKTVYYELVNHIDKNEAISQAIKEYDFKEVSLTSDNEVFKAEYVCDDGKIVARIESIDHSRTEDIRPDTNHNYLELYVDGEKIDSREYMFKDGE